MIIDKLIWFRKLSWRNHIAYTVNKKNLFYFLQVIINAHEKVKVVRNNKKNYFYQNDGRDLYDIVYLVLSLNKMSYIAFLKRASEGYGCSPSEGCGYSLDQNWDVPEDFNEVSFMFGDYESSAISPQKFVDLISFLSRSYIKEYQDDEGLVIIYITKLQERYQPFC